MFYSPSNKTSHSHAFIILPYNSPANIIINNLSKHDIVTATSSSETIRDLLHSSPQRNIVSDAGVYCILCRNSKSKLLVKRPGTFAHA